MNLLREYIRELLVEWEPANDKNLMLDQEGMEKSDRENVSQYLKSMGLLEALSEYVPDVSTVVPSDDYTFPVVPYPATDSPAGIEDLESTIEQYSNRIVPSGLQHACDENMNGMFESFLEGKGKTFNTRYYQRIRLDLIPLIAKLKDFYNRPRPAQVAQSLGIEFSGDFLGTAQSPSYPSGHTIQSYVIALLLSEQFPQYEEQLLSIAELVSQSRIDRGVHFPTDIDFGRTCALLIFSEMSDGNG